MNAKTIFVLGILSAFLFVYAESTSEQVFGCPAGTEDGEPWQVKPGCKQCKCLGEKQECITCDYVAAQEGSVKSENLEADYPDCCPNYRNPNDPEPAPEPEEEGGEDVPPEEEPSEPEAPVEEPSEPEAPAEEPVSEEAPSADKK